MNLKAIKGSYGEFGRIKRGVILRDISKDRAEKLIASGAYAVATAEDLAKGGNVIDSQVPSDSSGTGQQGDVELAKLTNKQLHELAAAEGIGVEANDNKATLVDKITAARAAAA